MDNVPAVAAIVLGAPAESGSKRRRRRLVIDVEAGTVMAPIDPPVTLALSDLPAPVIRWAALSFIGARLLLARDPAAETRVLMDGVPRFRGNAKPSMPVKWVAIARALADAKGIEETEAAAIVRRMDPGKRALALRDPAVLAHLRQLEPSLVPSLVDLVD